MSNNLVDPVSKLFDLPFTDPVLVFLLILIIVLLSPLLLEKIKIPYIVGFIIAGIIIGPHGFNLLSRNSGIGLFSTIGLLYLMFIAGIDLNLSEFKKQKHKSFVFGFLTFSLPILIGFPCCYYLLEYPLITSLLTSSMFATHTLVSYPIVKKYNISKNEAVAITVGGTILTDTAVLIILAVIIGADNRGLSALFWLKLCVSLIIFTVVVLLLVPRIAKWFFTKAESGKTTHYIFILTCLFSSAFFARLAGLEPIIGSFMAGLALNPIVADKSSLKKDIDFVGNSIFIPFFLISVGMVVDTHAFFKGSQAALVAITLTVVAIAGKWLAALVTQKAFNYSIGQRNLIFGLSSSHAAATMAIILIGFNVKIIDENILNGTIILILATCIVSSIATDLSGRTLIIDNLN
jgi:Kef-type K+ transport system membrane component KefB